jgi:hypothetical protein
MRVVHAYETWGFKGCRASLIDILNIWASFIYGPLLEDRVRSIADGVKPGEYGRREAFRVHQALREKGPVTVPREFVFMDRAAIGLGGVCFLHLRLRGAQFPPPVQIPLEAISASPDRFRKRDRAPSLSRKNAASRASLGRGSRINLPP